MRSNTLESKVPHEDRAIEDKDMWQALRLDTRAIHPRNMKLVCDNLTYYRRRHQEQKLNFFAVLENLDMPLARDLLLPR